MANILPLIILTTTILVRLMAGQSIRETFFLRKSLRKLIEQELRSSALSTSTRDKYVKTLFQLSAFPLKRNYTTVIESSEQRKKIKPTLITTPFTTVSEKCSPKEKVSEFCYSFACIVYIHNRILATEDLLDTIRII